MIGIRPGVDQTMASEWDFAVADLVIHEAGGVVTNLAGEPFRYNKRVPRNVGGLVAAADRETHRRVLKAAGAAETIDRRSCAFVMMARDQDGCGKARHDGTGFAAK
jgi:hypothetical protein